MYLVCIQPYSLERDCVGDPSGDPHVVSHHRSLNAAGRRLGGLISGKSKRYARHIYPRGGVALYVFDTDTGERYSRVGCQTGETLKYPPRAVTERPPA